MDNTLTKLFESERQLIAIIYPKLKQLGINTVFFPSLTYLENEKEDYCKEYGSSVASRIEQLEETFPSFERITEDIFYLLDGQKCPVCGEAFKRKECPTCGTLNDLRFLKYRVQFCEYMGGNKSAQILKERKHIEIVKFLKLMTDTGFRNKEYDSGIEIFWGGKSCILKYSSRWYLFRNKLKLRETYSRFIIIKHLWKLLKKEAFFV